MVELSRRNLMAINDGSAAAAAIADIKSDSTAAASGTTTAGATGNWRVTTSALANGTQSLTATAADVAGTRRHDL